MYRDDSPVIIGGTGGSGTRVLAQICMAAGLHMGNTVNPASDERTFGAFSRRWGASFLLREHLPLSEKQRRRMEEEFGEFLRQHGAENTDGKRWGWKHPRSMLLLPFLDASLPRMRFVHAIRDGRDMAYSRNQRQPQMLGWALLGPRKSQELSPACLAMAFWNQANIAAAAYGEQVMKERYHRIRFEDLCASPEETLQRLFHFLGEKQESLESYLSQISPPQTIGRWQDRPAAEIAELVSHGLPGLVSFGYLETES